MDTFLLALQLFTRLPIHKEIEVSDERLIHGIPLWPFVGLIVGGIDSVVYLFLTLLFPKTVAVLLTLLCQICVTGGFHLDGLCDTVDAIYSARDRQRMLEIMKDSKIGTFGVVAAIFDIGLRFFVLEELTYPLPAFLLGPIVGKCVQGLLMYRAKYPRESGLGASYVGKIRLGTMLSSLFIGLMLIDVGLFFFSGTWQILLAAPLVIVGIAGLYRFYIERKIDGMTGDTLGAGNEVCEIVFLLLLLAGQNFSWMV